MNGLLHAPIFHAPWLSALGWALVHSLWEGTLVCLATALILRGMRGSSSRARYLVAVLGLLVFAGLPLRRVASNRLHPSTPRLTVHLEQGRPLQATPRVLATNPAPALRTRVAGDLERALPWVAMAWGLGMLVFLLRLAGGWLWIQRLRWRKACLAPDSLQRQLLDLCRRAGLKRAVTLLTCEGLPGPSVVGFLRPAILVPTGWFLNLSPEYVEALLAHELAHVLRHDYLVNLMQSLLEVVFFYHPGLWWLSRAIRQEREMACDAFATRLIGNPLPLAEALTHLERRGLGRTNLEPSLAAHGGSLMERIQNLLLPAPRTSSAPAFGAVAVLTLLLATGLHMGAQSPDPTPTVAPTVPQGNLPGGTALYIRSFNAKDAEGKDIPYTQLLEIRANQVPLNQAWASFESVVKENSPNRSSESWATWDNKISGPRVNLDIHNASPADVLAVLNRLAKEHGVPPYQAPPDHALGVFKIGKHVAMDSSMRYDLYARQVSVGFLPTLLAEARRADASAGFRDGFMTFTRDDDKGTGPKVDALFEDLPLPELEKRVNALIENAR